MYAYSTILQGLNVTLCAYQLEILVDYLSLKLWHTFFAVAKITKF
ncbi:hypothetical protein MGWOODY_Clf1 [hydrothermal vent metagenome]|uniref:Uncharacterized protein n=1 Tax=hydrothermal vent metagenome TaxID=652676 RepID=A0A160VCC1_9ZZZZ